MKPKAKYLQLHEDECRTKGLLELIDQALEEARGDDYDGCFTARGRRKFEATKQILKERIADLCYEFIPSTNS